MNKSASQSHLFDIRGGPRIHYTQSGNPLGPLLICLHGLGGSVATFLPLLPYFPSEEYNIISVDFEGFGKTVLSNTSLSIEIYVNHVNLLISSLRRPHPPETTVGRDDRIVIIGHDLGSIVALHYAARYPSAITGLGLLAVGRSASQIQIAKQRMLRLAEKVRSEGIEYAATLAMTSNFAAREEDGDGRRAVLREMIAGSSSEAYAMVCEAMVSAEHIDPDYASIQCPAVFVSGRGDVVSPPGRAREVASLMGGITMVKVVRGGHQPILSDLNATKDAMIELFRLVELGKAGLSSVKDTTAGAS